MFYQHLAVGGMTARIVNGGKAVYPLLSRDQTWKGVVFPIVRMGRSDIPQAHLDMVMAGMTRQIITRDGNFSAVIENFAGRQNRYVASATYFTQERDWAFVKQKGLAFTWSCTFCWLYWHKSPVCLRGGCRTWRIWWESGSANCADCLLKTHAVLMGNSKKSKLKDRWFCQMLGVWWKSPVQWVANYGLKRGDGRRVWKRSSASELVMLLWFLQWHTPLCNALFSSKCQFWSMGKTQMIRFVLDNADDCHCTGYIRYWSCWHTRYIFSVRCLSLRRLEYDGGTTLDWF